MKSRTTSTTMVAASALLLLCSQDARAWAPPLLSTAWRESGLDTTTSVGYHYHRYHSGFRRRVLALHDHHSWCTKLSSSVADVEEASSTAGSAAVHNTDKQAADEDMESVLSLPTFVPDQVSEPADLAELKKKVINGLILFASFGFAAYTLLNVDHGMTRGWTHGEMALRTTVDNWSNYETALAEKPIYTKTLINVIIYLLGDWLSQTLFQKKNVLDFDAKRTLRNGFIGLCFGPLVAEYYAFSDWILPVEGGLMNRLEKIFMDQTIYLTVKCSIYIAAVGLLQGDGVHTVKESVKSRIGGVVTTAWKFWPLVHCVTYSVIPAEHRILWVNCVDLIWNGILATMSNQKNPEPVEGEEPVTPPAPDSIHAMLNNETLVADPFMLSQDVVLAFGGGSSNSTTCGGSLFAEDKEVADVYVARTNSTVATA